MMPWWRVIDGELIGAEVIHGPYGTWTLTESTQGNDAQGGWAKYPNENAARGALGVTRRLKGADRAALDEAIGRVAAPNLRTALIALRDNDPDPESGDATTRGSK